MDFGIDFGNTGWGGRPFWTFIKCPKRLMGAREKNPKSCYQSMTS